MIAPGLASVCQLDPAFALVSLLAALEPDRRAAFVLTQLLGCSSWSGKCKDTRD